MEEVKADGFNLYFYSVLSDMEDLCRNTIDEPEDDDDRKVLAFCKKLTDSIEAMDKKVSFADNLLDFITGLNPDEEDILFWDLAVPMYEAWTELCDDETMVNSVEERMEACSLVMASEMIIRIVDDCLGYGYFDSDIDEEKIKEEEA